MPLTIDMTTMSVVVAMTTPSSVRNDRSLWLRSASMATQKASRAVTHTLTPWRSLSVRFCMRAWGWLSTATGCLRPAVGLSNHLESGAELANRDYRPSRARPAAYFLGEVYGYLDKPLASTD